MPEKRELTRKISKRYTMLVMPEGESGRSHSYRFTPFGIIFTSAAVLASLIIIILVVLIYTPVGVYISIPNPELERRYLAELFAVQEKLNSVSNDVAFMREYNFQLRRALGENVGSRDTVTSLVPISPPQRADRGEVRESDRQPAEMYRQEAEGLTRLGDPVRMTTSPEPSFRPTLPIRLPADGYVTRRFDIDRAHFGMDIAGKVNTPIGAAADGTVIFSNWTFEDGNMVILSHGGGYFSVYKHNQANLIQPGAYVRRGETIALLGDTGKQSYGPHLHFELWKDGVPLDPSFYLFDVREIL